MAVVLEVKDIYKKCEELENSGVNVIRKPGQRNMVQL